VLGGTHTRLWEGSGRSQFRRRDRHYGTLSVYPLYTLHIQIFTPRKVFSVSQRDDAKQQHNMYYYNYNLFRVVRGREALAFANRYIKKVHKFSVLDCILYKTQIGVNSEKVTASAFNVSPKNYRNTWIFCSKKRCNTVLINIMSTNACGLTNFYVPETHIMYLTH
jgi:hypothetical protein